MRNNQSNQQWKPEREKMNPKRKTMKENESEIRNPNKDNGSNRST